MHVKNPEGFLKQKDSIRIFYTQRETVVLIRRKSIGREDYSLNSFLRMTVVMINTPTDKISRITNGM